MHIDHPSSKPASVQSPSQPSVSQPRETRSTSPSSPHSEVMDKAFFDNLLDTASTHLNADAPHLALALLKPHQETFSAKQNYGFQSRLGNAYMGVADALKSQNSLGEVHFRQDPTPENPHAVKMSCERFGAYIGVMGAYAQFLTVLQQPEALAYFASRNEGVDVNKVKAGVMAGIHHAQQETFALLSQTSAVHMSVFNEPILHAALERGALTQDHAMVQSFYETQRSALYQPLLDATAPLGAAAAQAPVPQLFLAEWLKQEKSLFLATPEAMAAANFVHFINF